MNNDLAATSTSLSLSAAVAASAFSDTKE